MTLRTKSRGWQWLVWLCAALVLIAAYIVFSRCLYGRVGLNPFDYRCHRLMIPLVAIFIVVARETRWDGIVREVEPPTEKKGEAEECKTDSGVGIGSGATVEREVASAPKVAPNKSVLANDRGIGIDHAKPTVLNKSINFQSPAASMSTGEELFKQARSVPHNRIPKFKSDGGYLELLGKSAAAGYAPAMTKMGEYAMRRAAWVEAYYWMTMARRKGMHGLSPTLRKIRKNWAQDGFPEEFSNVNDIFSIDMASLGRALIHLDSGKDASTAREFLKTNYPEFL